MGEDGLPSPRRYWAMAMLLLGVTMVVMDVFAVNVVLPNIARDFRIGPADSIWVINAFNLIITVTIFPLAALGERFGYRTVNIGGVALFTAASVLSAFAPALDILIAARVLQGLGASALMVTAVALIRHVFPRRMLGRAMAVNAAVISFGAALGPVLASAVLSLGSWRGLFALDVVVGVATLALAWRLLPHSPREHRPFDLIATALNVLAFGGLILGAESLARDGAREGLWELAVGVAAAVLLIRRELGRPAPLIPLDLMRNPSFSFSVVASILAFAAQMLAFVSLPFYLQAVMGLSGAHAGLIMAPWMVAVGCVAPLSGWLADRYPAGVMGAAGMLVFALGLAALALMPHTATTTDIVWRMMLCGFGFAIFQTPNNRVMLISAPRSRSGAAAGMMSAARLLGQTMGAVGVALCFDVLGVAGGATALAIAAGVAFASAVTGVIRLGAPGGAEQQA